MINYSEKMEYESAALVRDQINGLDQLTEDQKMIFLLMVNIKFLVLNGK